MATSTGKVAALSPVRANEGLQAAYNKRLQSLVDEMYASVLWWVKAAYRQNTPEVADLAQDASPAKSLQKVLRSLRKRWQDRFDDEAQGAARWFSKSAQDRADRGTLHSLRKAGLSVKFKMTPAMNDILQATTAENVSLIKSISSQFFTDIEGSVMRAVSQGRNLGSLTESIEHTYGVTHRRAALISRDQSNKANANMTRARQMELGIEYAIWRHSAGGRHPRPSHVAASGKRYKISEGMILDGVQCWPGTEINCRCYSKVILPALDTGKDE